MDEEKNVSAPQPAEDTARAAQDEALFTSLKNKKKRKKRRILTTVLVIVAIAAVALVIAVVNLRHRVNVKHMANQEEVLSYAATVGSISTSVSGSGTLANVDEETVTAPEGVEIVELLVEANAAVEKGQPIATVELSSVMSAMADVQKQLDDLDADIAKAANETVSGTVSAGVAGRLKVNYAQKGDDVVSCMYEHGCLALLSLDGYMALDLDTDALQPGGTVLVVREDGTELKGTVESAGVTGATILVTDDGTRVDETVTVKTEDGKELGSAALYVHSPLRVTAITGTVRGVYGTENRKMYAGSTLFALSDTSYSANYLSLLEERRGLEDDLVELTELYRSGCVMAPFNGSVTAVLYDEDGGSADAEADASAAAAANPYAALFASMGGGTATTTETKAETEGTELVTLAPDESMSVSINVDESKILALELDQEAEITVSSISEDTPFPGRVTEIDRKGTSASGVTRYTVTVTLDKDPDMLSGMSADAVVRIHGVDDAILIPVDALHQTSSTAYVYTTYDDETGEYGGLVEVTPGISNGSYVEIIEGLQEGDVVRYVEKHKGLIAYMMGAMNGMGMSGGMGMGGPGGRP